MAAARPVPVLGSASRWVPHVIAAGLALYYAWVLSGTRYVTTAIEFVSPLAIILIVHLTWLWTLEQPQPGFARIVLAHTVLTTAGIAGFVALTALYAPAPAQASGLSGHIVQFLAVLACLAVLAGVIFLAGIALFALMWGVVEIINAVLRWTGRPPGGGRLNDIGYIALALLAIGVASLEGVVPALSFATGDEVASTIAVAAPPTQVWQAVGKATSPSFPLPAMLKSIPQPVAVLVDEGATLGARRIVHFKGREGEGDLVLRVARRTTTEVVFEAVSDTSPVAKWVRQRGITFRVEPNGSGSLLTVSTSYDRLLSPAWFFRPYIGLAAYLAVDVLARDTKSRAEAG